MNLRTLITSVILLSFGVSARAQTFAFTTLAGRASSGSNDGVGSDARFNAPQGIAVDVNGVLYVADTENHVIRKITPDGTVTTLAGTAGLSGGADGAGSAARFNFPASVTVDGSGNV